MKKKMLMKGCSWKCRAYLTVEAAMIIPVVLVCLGMICMLVLYMYERCVFDENTCRSLVWKSYIEGINDINPANEEIEAEQMERYLSAYLQEEEADRYLLGGTVSANTVLKGNVVELKRKIKYPNGEGTAYEQTLSCCFLNPMETLRLIKLVQKQLKEECDNE